jgi:rhamnose utilization protein RhaD (predicted bifunctional aldolase and dehydrogenase)
MPSDALDSLLALSETIGRDPALVQAAGGNTSLKSGDVLWIKASGTWLMNARSQPIMVPVQLGPLLEAVTRQDPAADQPHDFTIGEENRAGLRPSIETTVHAVLPQRVVVHVHCVSTIAWACLRDAELQLAPRLAGFDWAFIPYVRPGLPLARAIQDRVRPITDVLVLGNHGLVVAADSVEDAAQLLTSVTQRLRRPARPAPPADANALLHLADGTGYRLPRSRECHATALDSASLKVAALGSLYPDHVIFLGPGNPILADSETVSEALARLAASGRPTPALLLVPGRGSLMRENASAGAEALARCLADVTARLKPGEDVVALSPADEWALLNWDAEQYRQSLNARARG